MSPGPVRVRFNGHAQALRGVVSAWDSSPVEERQSLAGRALELAGDLLRRAAALRPDQVAVDAALRVLSADAVQGFVATVVVDRLVARLTRAADEAVEASLPDEAEEQDTWSAWGLEGLLDRDRLESVAFALDRMSRLGMVWASALHARVARDLGEGDELAAPRARWFVALNRERRAERDVLDEALRERAWWFSARAECDGFLEALTGAAGSEVHLASCEACREDLKRTVYVDEPRSRHLSSDDLWRLDLQLASVAERSFARTHARTCSECAAALRAMDEAEGVLADGGTGAGSQPAPVRGGLLVAVRPLADVTVVDEEDFQVVLRRGDVVTLSVERKRPGAKLPVAAVHFEGGPPLAPRQVPAGVEYVLGDASEVAGRKASLSLAVGRRKRRELVEL